MNDAIFVEGDTAMRNLIYGIPLVYPTFNKIHKILLTKLFFLDKFFDYVIILYVNYIRIKHDQLCYVCMRFIRDLAEKKFDHLG